MWPWKESSSYPYLYILILMCFFHQGADSTICTDAAKTDSFNDVLPMCRSGTLIANRVVVDTYGTGVLDHDSCWCTVRLSGTNTGPVNLEIGSYPGTTPASGCRSKLIFTRQPSNTYTEYQCEKVTSDGISNFANSELLYITLSKANNNQWQSGYCIFIKSVPAVNIAVICDKGVGSGSSSATTTTSTTSTTTTKTTPPVTTKTTTPSSSSGSGGGVNGGDGYVKEDAIGIEVIAGAAVGGAVIVIIIIIVVVVVIKRKKPADTKRTEGNFTVDIQPYAVTTPKFYHNEGGDTLTQNSLYESADGPRDPDTNHIVTATGDVYAQVQKPTKQTHSEPEHSNDTEHTKVSPSGDVYATVSKSKKETNDVKDELQNDGDKRPSRYKNQDGLVYAEVDDTAPRPESRPQTRPPVTPKPTAISDRVIYAEVNTGV